MHSHSYRVVRDKKTNMDSNSYVIVHDKNV